MRRPLSGHQRSTTAETETWLTPPEWITALGPFDLDPCCPPNMPWQTAERMYTPADDGLTAVWEGRVWMNPPFGAEARRWLRKMVAHGNGIALVPARTETRMFNESVWGVADAVCFVSHRPAFYRADGTKAPFNSGAPIALIAYGGYNENRLRESGLGFVVRTKA